MRVALKVVFWTAFAALAASAGLTVAGSIFNLEAVLVAGMVGWFLGCLLLFAWSVLLALAWLRSRGARNGGSGGEKTHGAV
ncbi:hypothetical protein [Candidatus Solincola sp.]